MTTDSIPTGATPTLGEVCYRAAHQITAAIQLIPKGCPAVKQLQQVSNMLTEAIQPMEHDDVQDDEPGRNPVNPPE